MATSFNKNNSKKYLFTTFFCLPVRTLRQVIYFNAVTTLNHFNALNSKLIMRKRLIRD